MEAFMGFVQQYWPVVFFLWIYTVMKGGSANRAKYKKWDAYKRKKQTKRKKRR